MRVLLCPEQAPVPRLMTTLRSLPADTRGVTALEYALIAAIIGVVTVGAMQGVGNSLLQNFAIIVEASRETPQPMRMVDTRLPKPPMPKAPQAARAPVPDLEEDESSDAPETEAAIPETDEFSEALEPVRPVPGIAPSEPALGPWEDGLPVTALVTPPGRETSRRFGTGGSSAARSFPEGPPGRESTGEDSGDPAETDGAARAAPIESDAPDRPLFSDRQKAAILSTFILLLWTVFAIGLANLIWRIATRKAYEREVEDQLEDWQPASFG